MTWQIAKDMSREVAQTLQEARKHSRSIENISLSLEPLASEDELLKLERVTQLSKEVTAELTGLYNSIARTAFGHGSANEGPTRSGSA